MFLCCGVFLGSRLRSIMTHWKSEMVPQHLLPWLANTTAPKHLISWFRHPMSCSCYSPQTTAVLQQASASDMKVRLLDWLLEIFARCLLHGSQDSCAGGITPCTLLHSPFWLLWHVFLWCDFQVWKWSQTLVLILVSLSMDVAMAAAFPPAPMCHLHVTQDTHWVIRSQLFVNWIISGVTLFPVVMVRILFPFVRLYASVLMTAGSWLEVLYFQAVRPFCCCEKNISGTKNFFQFGSNINLDSRMELIRFWMLKVKMTVSSYIHV